MMQEFEFAPAKINLALHVTGRNEKNYHLLESLVVFANIGDDIAISEAKNDKLLITGSFAKNLDKPKDNLIFRALNNFRANWPKKLPNGLKIELKKNLPIASGIGGGSADCAATLRLLNKISQNSSPPMELQNLALSLGADVPICLSSKPAIMRNIGEIIEPIKSFPKAYIVLVNPNIAISTAKIFSTIKTPNNQPMPIINNAFDNINSLASWLNLTRNDLLPAAISIAPIIGQIIDEFNKDTLCNFTSMSGSGATVFGLFEDLEHAKKAAKNIDKKWPQFWTKYAPLISNKNCNY